MFTTAGLSRSAMSAKLTTPAMPGTIGRSSRTARTAETGGAETASLGDIDPVTTMPTRNDTHAVSPTVKHANRLVIDSRHYKLPAAELATISSPHPAPGSLCRILANAPA